MNDFMARTTSRTGSGRVTLDVILAKKLRKKMIDFASGKPVIFESLSQPIEIKEVVCQFSGCAKTARIIVYKQGKGGYIRHFCLKHVNLPLK